MSWSTDKNTGVGAPELSINGAKMVINCDAHGNVMMPDSVMDSTGMYTFSPASLPQTMTYGGPNASIDSVTVGPDLNGNSFKQTLTYTGSNVTSISAWVKQ